jgi:Ca2+-binding RTX toxin-like protein
VLTFDASHQYLDNLPGQPNGSYAISITVTDKDGGVGTGSTSIQVNNVPPTNVAGSAPAINEGQTTTLQGSFFDPGTLDTHTVVIDWGDGSAQTTIDLAANVLTFSAPHQYLDNPPGQPNGSYPVSITVTDKDGGLGTGSTSIRVNNVPPTASAAGPPDGVRGQERDFTFSAQDPSPIDQAACFTYTINWGDGSPVQTVATTAGNGSGITLAHVFTTEGNYNIQVTATDKDGGVSAVVSQQVNITPFEIQDDPLYPGKTMLVIGGTTGDDRIRIVEFPRSPAHLEFLLDRHIYSVPGPTSRFVVYGQAGNDVIDAGATITPAWLFGGDGNNILIGGDGNDVLVGGDGNDILIGKGGRDLLIGGAGADTLNAGQGDDILIAGFTDFDHNDAALAAIMAEWTSNHSYADRMANLSGTGSSNRLNGDTYLIAQGPAATVHSDSSIDVLYGGGGRSNDWFFADLDGPFADVLHGRKKGETVLDLDAAP